MSSVTLDECKVSGGAGGGEHAPVVAGKPSSMQHQFLVLHITILQSNTGQIFGAHCTRRQESESKFSKIFRG